MIKGSLKPLKILLLLLLAPALPAAPDELEPQLRQYIQQQLTGLLTNDQVTIDINPVSKHLNLTPCRTPIEFESHRPLKPGRFSIKASCQQPRRWSLNMRGNIRLMREVVISRMPLPSELLLKQRHLSLELRDVSQLRQGYFQSFDAVLGHQLKRALARHQVLSPDLVLPPLLIHKDEQVTIIAGKNPLLEVRVAGIALEDGRKDQQIRIRNKSSGKVISARVVAPGEVRAGL